VIDVVRGGLEGSRRLAGPAAVADAVEAQPALAGDRMNPSRWSTTITGNDEAQAIMKINTARRRRFTRRRSLGRA